jgi:hypothetical protein
LFCGLHALNNLFQTKWATDELGYLVCNYFYVVNPREIECNRENGMFSSIILSSLLNKFTNYYGLRIERKISDNYDLILEKDIEDIKNNVEKSFTKDLYEQLLKNPAECKKLGPTQHELVSNALAQDPITSYEGIVKSLIQDEIDKIVKNMDITDRLHTFPGVGLYFERSEHLENGLVGFIISNKYHWIAFRNVYDNTGKRIYMAYIDSLEKIKTFTTSKAIFDFLKTEFLDMKTKETLFDMICICNKNNDNQIVQLKTAINSDYDIVVTDTEKNLLKPSRRRSVDLGKPKPKPIINRRQSIG